MKAYVAVTDNEWFRFLRDRSPLDEVNFWQPGGSRLFKTLSLGEPFLFKLHYPEHYIAGGGYFAHASLLSSRIAWGAFREKNGAGSLEEMRRRVEKYRRAPADPYQDTRSVASFSWTRFSLGRATGFLRPRIMTRI